MNNDAISRSEALYIINEERRFIESLRETVCDNEDRAHNTGELGCAIRLARKIKGLPALDVAPVAHARWIHDASFFGVHVYHCSACEEKAMEKSRFCPNCGAKMEEEEHDA
jgi:hypothetical protein